VTKILLILIIGLVFEAVGVVFLSAGLKQIGELQQVTVAEISRMVARGAANRNILAGVFFEAIFFGCLIYLLSQRDVSLIWPLTSLGFVVTAIAARFFLHEEISPARWAGVGLIVVGAALVSYSEKAKPKPVELPSTSQTPTAAR
jgi:drug/metabolite transporter (DMT)-like permease